jgi:hypothetical protein
MSVVSLAHRGAHATGLMLISPMFVLFRPAAMFAAAAHAIPLVGAACGLIAAAAERRSHGAAS